MAVGDVLVVAVNLEYLAHEVDSIGGGGGGVGRVFHVPGS